MGAKMMEDGIPAFSAMMKMGLHLTNWLHEQNYFLIIWSSSVNIYMSHVTFRGISRCLIGSRTSCGRHSLFLGFAS